MTQLGEEVNICIILPKAVDKIKRCPSLSYDLKSQ
jgi:hypothetical protein